MQALEAATMDLRTIATLCRLLGGGVADPTADDASAAGDMLAVAGLLCDTVVEDGVASLAVLSHDGRILFANDAFAVLLGAHASALRGEPLAALLEVDRADVVAQLLHDARLMPGLPMSADLRLRRTDGGSRRIRLVLRASPRSPVGNLVCGAFDIAGRTPLSRPSDRGDDEAVVSIDSALDAIVSMDADGVIRAFNSAAERVFGLRREQAIGRSVSDVLIPDLQRTAHRVGLDRHLATDQNTMLDRRMELTALHADGHEFPIEITVTWVGDGHGRRYTAFIRDVSERTRLVADLRTAAERLAAVVEAQQRLAASDVDPVDLIGQVAEFARELLDGERAVFEPQSAAAAPAVDATSDDLPLHTAICRDEGAQSQVLAPLRAGGRMLGVITVTARRPLRYVAADAHALELFAASLGAVMQRREADLRRRIVANRQAEVVAMQREFSTSSLALPALMQLMAQRAQSLTGATGGAVEWIEGDEMVYVAASGAIGYQVGLRLTRSGSLSGRCVTLDQAQVCVDTGKDPRVFPPPCGGLLVRSFAVVPLRADDTIIGALKVVSPRVAGFDDDDVHHLQILAETMASIIHRRRAVDALAESESQYRLLFDSNPHPMWVTDLETQRFIAVNAAARGKYGYSEDEFLAMTVADFQVADGIEPVARPTSTTGLRRRHRCKDGTVIDADLSDEQIRFGGRRARLVMALDVTRRLRAEAAEARATRALRLLSACNAALVRISEEQPLLETICRIFIDIGGYRLAGLGYAAASDDQSTVLEPRTIASRDPQHAKAVLASWREITADDQCPASVALRSNRAAVFADLREAAELPWCRFALANGFHSAVALPLRNDAGAFGFLSLYADQSAEIHDDELALLQEVADNTAFGITAIRAERERRHFLAELAYSASHDAVTGLERYVLLEHRLADIVAQPAQTTSIALLDLDRFSSLNETLGHDAADLILRCVGERLLAFADARVLVAHFASDEFVIVMSGISADAAALLAERLRAAVAQPIETSGFAVMLTATVGISHSPAHGTDARELVRRAQAAMERGKLAGRDCSHAFLTEQMQDLDDRALLGAQLRRAVDRDEMRLHYQPQYAAASGQLTGFEALLRWHSAELGAVTPARFIPIAETLGLMPALGGWVVHDACRQARAWLDDGHRGFRIAVNVSGQQLMRPGLVQVVSRALDEFALPPHLLDLELTESSLMENVVAVQGTLAELKALGVSLSLDDFGTGYSSLAYLKHFSLDKLKIDRSFVHGLPDNADDAAIARTIVSMGHQLRLLVSAEGVETRAQAEFLRGIGCDELQGYHFGHPVAADDAARFFDDQS